jgi:hypothetical protein
VVDDDWQLIQLLMVILLNVQLVKHLDLKREVGHPAQHLISGAAAALIVPGRDQTHLHLMPLDEVCHQIISVVVRVTENLFKLHVVQFGLHHVLHVVCIHHACIYLLVIALVLRGNEGRGSHAALRYYIIATLCLVDKRVRYIDAGSPMSLHEVQGLSVRN